ncbi:GspH/FimT family pseudopilin [uncultured Gilvimarinus sp.]|uniref:GspH/FimT family pseudopilin n=1 Tax=uncultured Gilvimarinus sp. TaxID=1689143 RepID=UPI0030DCB782
MKLSNGFSLLESMVSITIMAIMLAIAIPGFQELVQSHKVKAITEDLLVAIQTARSHAVKDNRRVTLAADPTWEDGWIIFHDGNHDGDKDSEEALLLHADGVYDSVTIKGNRWVNDYISYLGTGESRWASGSRASAFQAGTINICPKEPGPGYALILARGGRLRKERIDAAKCANSP